MMQRDHSTSVGREAVGIFLLSVFVAFLYNAFSPKSISLIRKIPVKTATANSVLFPQQHISQLPSSSDSSNKKSIPVIAPLHERALRNPDSMAALEKNKKRDAGYKIVTLEQVKRLMAEQRGVLLDARGVDEFEKGHIHGARNIPYFEVEKHFEEMMTIPRDTLILIYCSNPECPLGRNLVDFMTQMEFHTIYLYDDGWDGWEKAGMPAEKSSEEKR